jgi:hypothetical protein
MSAWNVIVYTAAGAGAWLILSITVFITWGMFRALLKKDDKS